MVSCKLEAAVRWPLFASVPVGRAESEAGMTGGNKPIEQSESRALPGLELPSAIHPALSTRDLIRKKTALFA